MLLHFPEQFRPFTYFNMTAKVNSGYDISSNPVTYWGVLQNSTTMVKDSNGNLATAGNEFLWTDQALTMGWFVQFGDIVYRIIPSGDWITEGGFTQYSLQKIIGDNGSLATQAWAMGGTPV
jgi:hypothetical protein